MPCLQDLWLFLFLFLVNWEFSQSHPWLLICLTVQTDKTSMWNQLLLSSLLFLLCLMYPVCLCVLQVVARGQLSPYASKPATSPDVTPLCVKIELSKSQGTPPLKFQQSSKYIKFSLFCECMCSLHVCFYLVLNVWFLLCSYSLNYILMFFKLWDMVKNL